MNLIIWLALIFSTVVGLLGLTSLLLTSDQDIKTSLFGEDSGFLGRISLTFISCLVGFVFIALSSVHNRPLLICCLFMAVVDVLCLRFSWKGYVASRNSQKLVIRKRLFRGAGAVSVVVLFCLIANPIFLS